MKKEKKQKEGITNSSLGSHELVASGSGLEQECALRQSGMDGGWTQWGPTFTDKLFATD